MRILTIHGDILLQAPCPQLLNIIVEEIVHRDCNDTEGGFYWLSRTLSDQDARKEQTLQPPRQDSDGPIATV